MKLTSVILAAMLLASPAANAAAAEKVVHTVDGFDRLVIPQDSPVTLEHVYEDGAEFSGRFILTGTIFVGCPGCKGMSVADIPVYFVPDAKDAERLPHWRKHNNAIRILLDPLPQFDAAVLEPRTRISMGQADIVMAHASIVVEAFTTTLDCGTANFQAKFVAFAEEPKLQVAEWGQNYGCG